MKYAVPDWRKGAYSWGRVSILVATSRASAKACESVAAAETDGSLGLDSQKHSISSASVVSDPAHSLLQTGQWGFAVVFGRFRPSRRTPAN